MTGRRPDFVIIGAMKCATSTLHEQLARRSGLFLSRPKEPNFFSDDEQWARGLGWYEDLFARARPEQRCGESSTHYTKLPVHPRTVERMRPVLPEARLVYVMRDPLDRIVSQYIHEWTERTVDEPIDVAVRSLERFAAYSAYARQLEPFLEAWGPEAILPVAYERMLAAPHETLELVCRFIGDPTPDPPRWAEELGAQNVSSERLRRSPLRDRILQHPVGDAIKNALPRRVRQRVKTRWTLAERPRLSEAVRLQLEDRLDPDLERLGKWLGRPLSCRTWQEVAAEAPFSWADLPAGSP